MKPYLACGLILVLLGGCATPPPVRTVQVLENSGTEFPAMCMLLQSDGSLLFKGGFLFYNPSAWRRDAGDGELLTITVGGSKPFPEGPVAAGLVRSDASRRELTYRFGPSAQAIDFAGFYFYRVNACQAQ